MIRILSNEIAEDDLDEMRARMELSAFNSGRQTLGLEALPAYATSGAGALDSFLNGAQASHQEAPAIDTAIGHSYGSTTVVGAAGASDHRLAVDNGIAVGSPGMMAGHASDLNLDPGGQVYAKRAQHDIIHLLAGVARAVRHAVDELRDPNGDGALGGSGVGTTKGWRGSQSGLRSLLLANYPNWPGLFSWLWIGRCVGGGDIRNALVSGQQQPVCA